MEALREETRVAQKSQTRKQALHDALTVARAHAAVAARASAHALFVGVLVGGVFAAPALVAAALVVLFAPMPLGARHIAPALIFASLAWLALAIFGAHAQVAYGETAEGAPDADPLRD
jgi:hypothetical protein